MQEDPQINSHFEKKENRSIVKIELVGETAKSRSPEIELERHRALSDLMHKNKFTLKTDNTNQSYHMYLKLIGDTLALQVNTTDEAPIETVSINLRSYKRIVKDYFMICESFYKFARSGMTAKVEAIDMARRGIHNEGAEKLQRSLKKYAECDFDTARQLFTLICILHIRITV